MESIKTKKLTIGISSMALFDLVESNKVFETEGKEAYCRYQIEREDECLSPGVAYPLVKKLLGLNERLPEALVEVILLSRNSADTGLRVFNSIREHGLDIKRAVFTSGATPFVYISAFEIDLFLSTSPDDVRKTLEAGHAGATILSGKGSSSIYKDQLRIAFDGDAVIFSDESERIYKEKGLDAFTKNEQQSAKMPMSGGPFKSFLAALHHLQSHFPEETSPVRTALVTARSAPAHERVVRTLRSWNIRIDEALFLGGLQKGEFLKSFGADIFFDDQTTHCESANEHVATGHVPHGIANE
ncbi:MAG: 5'-nucleotidase [Piscirickettsiaceae bacterium]|nr:MAG: 5'-nucleotidase [Piscirickettsiaceae bacterium]